MLSFIYICHHPFLWLNDSSLFPWLQQQTPRFSKSPALAAKVLMILCQSEMQPGFKDRTPGVCQWWVVILMISYKGWVGVVMCVNTPRWTTGGWWWASLLYCYHYHPQNPHFFYCLIINHHHYYSCHYYHLVVVIIISDDAEDDPNFPRIASDSEDPSHARHCEVAATDAHPDPWPRMIWKPSNRGKWLGVFWDGGPFIIKPIYSLYSGYLLSISYPLWDLHLKLTARPWKWMNFPFGMAYFQCQGM